MEHFCGDFDIDLPSNESLKANVQLEHILVYSLSYFFANRKKLNSQTGALQFVGRLRGSKKFIIVFVIFGLFNMTMVHGWSNGGFSTDSTNPKYGTHDWIAQHALDWLPSK